MRRPAVAIIAASLILIIAFIPLLLKDANAHGVGFGFSRPTLRIDSEQFSDTTIGKGDILIIKGTLVSIASEHEFTLSPYVSVSSNPFGPFDLAGFPQFYYPLSGDTASWYFRIEHSMPNPVVVKPGEEIDYEIRLYPLKAGTYHVHSFFISEEEYLGRKDLVGRGATVIVTGSTTPTVGEVTQLYLPLAVGVAAMLFLVPRVRKISRELGLGRLRKGIRAYFAVKCSLEALWLVGLWFWLALAAYPVLHSFEARLASAMTTIAIISFITIGSYFAAVGKSQKLQRVFAAGMASASALFYFLLLFGTSFDLDMGYGGFGYNRNPFDVHGLILFAAAIVNSIIAVLALFKRKDRHEARRVTDQLTSR